MVHVNSTVELPFSQMCVSCILDINECSSNPCHGNGICNNTAGSYMCVCDSGYSGDGFNCPGTHNFLRV